jgi:hypothetical protein
MAGIGGFCCLEGRKALLARQTVDASFDAGQGPIPTVGHLPGLNTPVAERGSLNTINDTVLPFHHNDVFSAAHSVCGPACDAVLCTTGLMRVGGISTAPRRGVASRARARFPLLLDARRKSIIKGGRGPGGSGSGKGSGTWICFQ